MLWCVYIAGAVIHVLYEYFFLSWDAASQERFFSCTAGVWMDWLLDIRHCVYGDVDKRADTILMVSNHVNLLDSLMIGRMCREILPDHRVSFVYGDCAGTIPVVNDFMKRHHIYVRGMTDMKLDFSKKNVIVFFPEGRLLYERTMKESIDYSASIGEEPFLHVMYPRKRGFQTLCKILPADTIILDTTLVYPWQLHSTHDFRFVRLIDFARYPIFDTMYIIVKETTPTSIVKLWREKDAMLDSMRHSFHTSVPKQLRVYPEQHTHDKMLWHSSQLALVILPFIYITHGLIMTIMSYILFLTSYAYHYHRRFLWVDRLVSRVCMGYALLQYRTITGRMMLVGGMLMYFCGHPTTHLMLHALSYMSVFCEFMHVMERI